MFGARLALNNWAKYLLNEWGYSENMNQLKHKTRVEWKEKTLKWLAYHEEKPQRKDTQDDILWDPF